MDRKPMFVPIKSVVMSRISDDARRTQRGIFCISAFDEIYEQKTFFFCLSIQFFVGSPCSLSPSPRHDLLLISHVLNSY